MRKEMKRLLAIILCLVLGFNLVACSKSESEEKKPAEPPVGERRIPADKDTKELESVKD